MSVVIYWAILTYFVVLNGSYLLLNLLSLILLRRRVEEQVLDSLPQVYTEVEIPVSILVPAYNEAGAINATVHSLLRLVYSEFEVLVIDDGSSDDTLRQLQLEFGLLPFPEAYRIRLVTEPIDEVYRSTRFPNLRVIRKQHGGKADALNAGINAARYPLYCCVNVNVILQCDSLQHMVKPFLDDTTVVAAGGTVRVANDCKVEQGFLKEVDLSSNPIALFQVIEYLRSYLFGRLGWSWLNGMLIISGTFSLFHKDTVVQVGGYRAASVAGDMDLVVRLHHRLRQQQRTYRVAFVPEPVCWAVAPFTLSHLKKRRMRWQHAMTDSLFANRGLMFSRHGGIPGWLAFPFMLIFECFGPAIELASYAWMLIAFVTGTISLQVLLAFLIAAIGLGILLSISGLLLEEMSFHLYPKKRHLIWLTIALVIENIGYRQLNAFWRVLGMLRR